MTGQPIEMLMPQRFREQHPEHIRSFFSIPVASSGVLRQANLGAAYMGILGAYIPLPIVALIRNWSLAEVGGGSHWTHIVMWI